MSTSFKAFVSYCHADRKFAANLQRKLESYRLPKRVVREAEAGSDGSGDRIGPIFRDRADLSASQDLSAAVRTALAASTTLVVVASPDAARSHWVAREMALFRELHPQAPVLIALFRGNVTEGLPASFLSEQPEPLAADFQAKGDGPRLAFLKIVAGIAGLPLDALVQRDAQRRVRRVRAVTLSALLLALLMAAVAAFALVSRAEAVRERKQAEGLIEFMLTDLREKLRGVGRLDVMERVNTRALDYYAAQGDLSQLPDDSLLRRARLLHAMGEDDDDAGRSQKALREFQEAHRVTEALLGRRPNDTDRIFAHAQSEFWLGSAALEVGDSGVARRHFEQYAALVQRLIAVDPRNKDWQMEGGYAESNLGTLAATSEKRPDLARLAFDRAGAHFETARRLAPNDPGIVHDLADNHGWLADTLYDQGKFDQAFLERLRERGLIEGLTRADPQNANYARDLVESSIGLARIEVAQGRRAEALARLRQISDMIGMLAARDPANKRTVRLQGSVMVHMAGLIDTPPSAADAPILAAALKACATPGALRETAEQQRLCEQLRTRESGVSIH